MDLSSNKKVRFSENVPNSISVDHHDHLKESLNGSLLKLIKIGQTGQCNKENVSPKINYRLLYQLHSNYSKTKTENPIELWSFITKDYNFVTSSAYLAEEIKHIWKSMPLMEKRKLELLSYPNDEKISEVGYKKTQKLKKNDSSSLNQNQSANHFSKTLKKRIEVNDQNVQTEFNDYEDLMQLIKEERILKISLLKLRLKLMSKQFIKHSAIPEVNDKSNQSIIN